MDTSPLRDLFTRVASRYDALNRALTFGIDVTWRLRAIKRLHDPVHVLDLATGTADLALAIARKHPASHITALDLTPAMLKIARNKIIAAALSARITTTEGDAHALQFENNSFDAVTCAFGFRNFPDKKRAISEAARVLRPGGTLLVLELFRMTSPVFSRITSAWLRLVTPIMAPTTKADYAYLRKSITHTLSAAEFIALAESENLKCIESSFFLPSCRCLVFRKQ